MLSNQQPCAGSQDVKVLVNVRNDGCTAKLHNVDLSSTSDIHFKFVKDGYGSQIVTSLSITSCTIPVLNNDILKHFPNLTTLGCTGNTIDEISDDAFEASKDIQSITLHDCKIQKIAENAFNTKQNLSSINLRNNLLQKLPKKLFYHLVNLQHLNLTANKLKEIDVNIFKHLYQLNTLYVNDNYLLKFNLEKVFKYSPNLKTIGLSGNDFYFEDLLEMIKLKNKLGKALGKSFGKTDYLKERKRDYPVLLIEGVDCVDEETFAKLVANRVAEITNEQLVQDLDSALIVDGEVDGNDHIKE